MKRKNLFIILAAFFLMPAAAQADKVELPFTLCGQQVYKAGSQSTMTVGTEIVDSYELVGVADSGAVYYLPQKQALLLDNAIIDYRQKAFVIQSLQDIHLTIMVRGECHINSIGTVVYSIGALTVSGEETEKSALHIHGVDKKGYNIPEYGLFSGRDMTLSNLTFHAEGFRHTIYGIQAFGDEKTSLHLERVQGDLLTRGDKPCVVRGFNYMRMQDCGPSRDFHGTHFIRYYGIRLQEDGENCRELHLVLNGTQPASPDRVVEKPSANKSSASGRNPAQRQETITLPVVFANQTTWKAVEKTVVPDLEGEAMTAYELQEFERVDGTRRKGTVYYIPSGLNDRIMLMFKDVQMTNENLPAIIDNRTDKTLIIYMQGSNILKNNGSVIRSQGPVSLFGEETDSPDFKHRTTLYSGGRYNRAAIEAVGDVSIQYLNLNMADNRGIYAIRSVPSGEEAPILTLNHVKGKMNGQRGAVYGFGTVEGTHCEIEGVDVTETDDTTESEIQDGSDPPVADGKIYSEVEVPAYYGESVQSLNQYVADNMQYPRLAEEQGIQGRVILSFVVETDGTLSNIEILRSVDGSLDKEALRLIESTSGDWTPGKQHGKPVRCKFTVPVNFRLK